MKKIVLIISIISLVIICIISIFLTLKPSISEDINEWTYEKQGWIDCMPPLSETEAKICEDAEKAGYKYIAH